MGYFLGPLGQFFSEIWPPYFWKPWMSPYVAAGAFFFRKMAPRFFKSHGPLFWTPRKNIFGVMGLFFGPLGQFFMIS